VIIQRDIKEKRNKALSKRLLYKMHPILHVFLRVIFRHILVISASISKYTSKLQMRATAVRPKETDIDLYTSGTPNGQKANCLLEELGLSYKAHNIDLSKNEQKQEWFLKINPNGRIPALVDNTPTTGNGNRVFESGALMLYLCEKYDQDHRISFPYDSDDYWEAMSWHIWMQSGLGPMQGQANHFYRYAPEKIEYGIDRYQTETKRLFGVLEERLKEQELKGLGLWIVGGKYSFVDLNCWCWVNWAEWAGVRIDGFPRLAEWAHVIQQRDAVKRGVDGPDKFEMKEAMKTKKGEAEYAEYHSNWVMQGQMEDQEKHK
jgi:glutathione S-transferase